ARELIYKENFEKLLEFEQLTNQINYGYAFTDYIEGPITFFPTYKYDNGSDEYDTSEKARIPAWTDRILYRGNKIRQIGYSRAELRVSDHRPVMSSFDIEVIKFDEAAKKKLQGELYIERQKIMSGNSEKSLISDNGEKKTIHLNNNFITNGDGELEKTNYDRKFDNLLDDFKDDIVTTNDNKIKKETGPAVGILINVDENNKKEGYKSPMVVDKNVINRKYRSVSSNPFYELNPNLTRSMSLKPLIPSKPTSKPVIRQNSMGNILRKNIFTENDNDFLAKAPKF
ncbi:33338_t:CDS:2, partial [Racocetra persica]